MDRGIASEHISFILPERVQSAVPPVVHPSDAAIPPATTPPLPPPAPPEGPIPFQAPLADPLREQVEEIRAMPSEPEQGYRYDALGAVIPDPAPAAVAVRPEPAVKTMAPDHPIDVVEGDHAHVLNMKRNVPEAASGISTTTAGDAAKGALGGAGIGLGLGVLLGLAAVAIPGIGLVAGAGALVAGLTAATGAAGAIAGGVYGYLCDLGLPPETARRLSDNLQAGGPILSITLTGEIPEGEIVSILRKYGATTAEVF
jgi:hypothetical protein